MRQFQRQFFTELKNVPFIVTRQRWVEAPTEKRPHAKERRELPEFIVVAYDPNNPMLKEQPKEPEQPTMPQEQNTPPKKKGILDFFK